MPKFLIIDDDPMTVRVWANCFKKIVPGCQIEIYASTEFGLSSIESFDLIIVDIFLSGDKTGLEFLSTLPRSVLDRVIISSSVGSEEISTELSAKGLNCQILPKPIDTDQILDLLRLRFPRRENLNKKGIKSQNPNFKYKPVIFVTGCSSGIGAELAKLLVKIEDYRVVLTCRKKSLLRLKECFPENERIMLLPVDLTSDSDIQSAIQKVAGRWGRIDILVNNAGISYRSVVEQMDRNAEIVQMQTNYLGPMTLTRAAISTMRESGRGKIINVSSVSGIMGMPTMGSYSASKHALEGASESLWYELAPLGINVTVVRPGFINSEGHTHVVASEKARIAERLSGPYFDFYQFMRPFVSRLMGLSPANSESIARKILLVIKTQNPPLWVNASLDASFFSLLRKVLPSNAYHRLLLFVLFLSNGLGKSYSRAAPNRLKATGKL